MYQVDEVAVKAKNRRAWGSLAYEILTTPSVLKDPLQLVPLAFSNITQSIKKEKKINNT